MAIYNMTTGGGGDGVISFPLATTIKSYQFRGAVTYSYSYNQISGYSLIETGYITTLYNASFPNATTIESYAFYGQLNGNIYLPAVTNISSVSSSAFARAGIIHLPNLSGTINFTSYFMSCAGVIGTSNLYLTALISEAQANLTVLSCAIRMDYSLSSCPLVSATLYSITTISSYTFGRTNGPTSSTLTYLCLPDVTTISSAAFYGIRHLSTIILPKVSLIGTSAFQSCVYLTTLNLQGVSSVPTLSTGALTSTPMSTSAQLGYFGSIYVPKSLYTSFTTATNWTAYSARMVSI